jgi:hypothetical protein
VGTINRLWATRRQLLDFDRHVFFERATAARGPGLRFLHPRLTTADISALANGRAPSRRLAAADGEVWTFTYQRRPVTQGKSVNLELDFQGRLLTRIGVDRRFSEALGDARIEMLLREFTGQHTSLDLFGKRVVCRVPAAQLARFTPLRLADIRALFGPENLVREAPLPPEEPRYIFRYTLEGTSGEKAAMSFGATFLANSQVGRITSRIGSFSLEFDLSGRP